MSVQDAIQEATAIVLNIFAAAPIIAHDSNGKPLYQMDYVQHVDGGYGTVLDVHIVRELHENTIYSVTDFMAKNVTEVLSVQWDDGTFDFYAPRLIVKAVA